MKLQPLVRTLGIARSPRAVRLLRDAGVYVPLRLLYDGASEVEKRRLAELRAFRRSEGPLLRGLSPNGAGRHSTVLFPHMSPGLLRTRVDGMLAKALALRGCRPVFVTHRHELWHEEYLRAFGFREFVFLDDYLPDPAGCEARARELLRGCSSQDDVLALESDGSEIGRHAGSRVLKDLRIGSIDPQDPAVHEALERRLASSVATVIAARRILDEVKPDVLVTSVKGYTPWGEFFDESLRREIDTIYWYRSHLEHSLLFRRFTWEDRHEHFFTLSDETWEELRRAPWSLEEGKAFIGELRESYLRGTWFERKKTLQGKRLKSPAELHAELGLDPARKTAFVFSHVLYDATFWFGENLFADYADWLIETSRAAAANPEVNWVIKMHPENVLKSTGATGAYDLESLEEYRLIREAFPKLPDHVRLMLPENDTNTVSLFEFADYALTVRGTVGLEFPCFGVPTFTAGTGGYSGRGFTVDSRTPKEYLARLASIHDVPPLDEETTAVAQRFSYGVFQMKPVPMRSFTWTRQAEKEGDPLGQYDFEVTVRDPDELRQAQDLELFARWVLDSQRRDLLAPGRGPLVRELETFEDVFEDESEEEAADV